jgi:hypothetical protein
MKRFLVMAVVAMMATMSAMAQFPENVKEVLKKCDEKMDYPSGMVIDMTLKVKVAILSMNGTLKVYSKGDKNFTVMTMKAMGKEISTEYGFDGQQEWDYEPASSKKEKDSLIITKTTKPQNNDYDINMDYEKDYRTAKMKDKGLYYEIDFANRINKDAPKKLTIKIAKDTYYLREIKMPAGSIGSATMTVTKVTKGCSDNWFKLDMNRYKNAVVVRR